MGRRQPVKKIVKEEEGKSEEGFVEDRCEEKPPQPSSPPPPVESDGDVVVRLRERWELASVLNFLRVFKPFIGLKMEVSAEEIEKALITPNNTLAQLHIAILKGIPPVSKNLAGSDAWVTILLKKLTPWWPWVAEGEIPLNVARGEEISKYKELDPMRRLTILKALCEVRADQDDITRHISDALKKEGTEISTFRKERIGGDGNGTSYWYDGDESIGHRLYREVTTIELMPKLGKGRLAESKNSYQWETIATNLEEFQQISVKLSSSKVAEEAAVSQVIENEIIPVLERIEKKKEQALKRQQKEEMLLSGALNYYRTENTRSCRSRKPVKYTFDDYDKSIDAALHLIEKGKTPQGRKNISNGHGNGDASNSNSLENDDDMDIDSDNKKLRESSGESDTDDGDFDEKKDDNDNKSDEEDDDASGESTDSENEHNRGTRQHATRRSLKQNAQMTRDVTGLRRSRRLTGDADTKKILRQRPTRNTINKNVTDSEDGSDDSNEAVAGSDSEDAKSSEKTSNEESGTEESGGVENGSKSDSEGTGDSGGVAEDDNNEEESSKGDTEESGGVENVSGNNSEEEKNSEDAQSAENGSTNNSEDKESPGMEEGGSGDESEEEEKSNGSEENEAMDDSDDE